MCGTRKNDLISGKPGNDVIRAKAGNDQVNAEAGYDEVHGGGGSGGRVTKQRGQGVPLQRHLAAHYAIARLYRLARHSSDLTRLSLNDQFRHPSVYLNSHEV